MSDPVQTEACGRCDKALSENDRVEASGRLFCRSCYETLRLELRQAVTRMSTDVNYPMAVSARLIVLAVGLITLVQRWRNPIPGYDALPRGRRLAVGLGYAALVSALVVTLPLGAPAG